MAYKPEVDPDVDSYIDGWYMRRAQQLQDALAHDNLQIEIFGKSLGDAAKEAEANADVWVAKYYDGPPLGSGGVTFDAIKRAYELAKAAGDIGAGNGNRPAPDGITEERILNANDDELRKIKVLLNNE